MRLVLINPPNGSLDKTDLAPPLGLLSLAAGARQHGHQVYVKDLNLEVMGNPDIDGERFYETAVDSILRVEPHAVGLTSMCMESHVSLEIARQTKAKSPGVVTILGGTHFGPIGREVMTLFPFVDFVVVGEGENAIAAILECLDNNSGTLPKNVLYREGTNILSGSAEQETILLDDLPFPAYDLVDLDRYFTLNPRRVLDYDGGRGCVFKCAFCYSPFQYGDAVRNKRPSTIVSDLRRLSELGAEHVFFVQDNFLNSPNWAAELCTELATAQLTLTWSCYVTFPQLTKELVSLMSSAGCLAIFTGIDAVSRDYQRRMNKLFLRDWQVLREKLAYCIEQEIVPTCAFILEGPDQSPEEREDTIRTAVECIGLGCEVHVNTLSIYNGSKLEHQSGRSNTSYSAVKVRLLMDSPCVVQENDYARRWPKLFPYHSSSYEPRRWEMFLAKVHTLFALLWAFPKTLQDYVVDQGHSVWDAMDYIDDQYVEWLVEQPSRLRRSVAVEKFCESFALRPLSKESRFLFQREVARFTLLRRHGVRHMDIMIDGVVQPFNLSWFVDLSKTVEYSFGKDTPLAYSYPHKAGAPARNLSPREQETRHEVALLSQENTVRITRLLPKVVWVLSACEEAAALGRMLSLDKKTIEYLEREGWIWRRA